VDIGLLGGSFDPPHLGHLIVAQDALERLGLDRIRFVPARVSPFKLEETGATAPEVRMEMILAAIAGHPGFEATRVELDRPGPSWTVDTLRELRRAQPGVRPTLLLGGDQWTTFSRWREPDAILELARVAVFGRDGVDPEPLEGLGGPHCTVPVTRVDLSSTAVRERVRRGRSIRYLVPEPVRVLIEANGLYTTC
jgi:nicotinate-nucleotide adenylyltransferase